jgi:probable HAF family extracellular repeat protein
MSDNESSRMNPLMVGLALAATATLIAPLTALAGTGHNYYTVQELTPLPGGSTSRALGLNEFGDVVGVSNAPAGLHRGVLWRDGQVIQISGSSNSGDSSATAINDGGVAVGLDGVFGSNAYTWQDGVGLPLGTFIDCCSEALDVNENGLVVGFAAVGSFGNYQAAKWEDGNVHSFGFYGKAQAVNDLDQIVGTRYLTWAGAFLAEGDVVMSLGTLGGQVSEAFDINNLSQVVGYSITAEDDTHPFIWQDGAMTDLTTLPGTDTGTAFAINDLGAAVGETFLYDDFQFKATLWESGQMPVDLNDYLVTDEDWLLETAHDINNAGQIVGSGRYNGQPRAFLLTPTATLGDLDGDGDVDQADLGILLASYGVDDGGDLDGDGDTDQADLGILLANYGS